MHLRHIITMSKLAKRTRASAKESYDTLIKKAKMASAKPHPLEELQAISQQIGHDLDTVEFARHMDSIDPLRYLRQEFCYPKMKTLGSVDQTLVDPDEDCVYFCGNSLGICPKKTREYLNIEVDKWEKTALEGHTNGDLPWAWCDEGLDDKMATIVGAKPGEVSIMNGLTVNLHLLLISFYRPTPARFKILMEGHAFPSDHYAVESQIKLKGYNPDTAMILMEPREGEHILRKEDILKVIEEQGNSIALVCLSGVQYYTGQKFDMQTITQAAQEKGCVVGWDLAHAVGNVEIKLHDWNVDFACWCTYKYLNCGAGCLAGLYIHERHYNNDYPRLTGWWGHQLSTRFEMDNKFSPYPGAKGYRLSNTPGFLCPPIKASLEIFEKTSIKELTEKCRLLTGYLEARIIRQYGYPDTNTSVKNGTDVGNGDSNDGPAKHVYVEILTPSDLSQRGAQLSLSFSVNITQVFKELMKRGVVCDERKPKVIRIAPAPLYCSFEDVHRFMRYLDEALHAAHALE
ncbi:kynureninase-like isoform X2 [Ruditapes philippinarum]|uniref:kynureninase-like isoform X2 n=1 Tax=Ruditapes philippinarum TaxID=129788 RepID=UPI00295A570E|nr:kynureninase-like isoform X2 [Ruditapes philippinarum]